MVFVTTSGPSLCISPWKDGLKPREIVRFNHLTNITSVLIIFPENGNAANDRNILNERELMELFHVIAHEMPSVRSITISGGNYSSQPPPLFTSSSRTGRKHIAKQARIVPPIKAITSLLRGKSGAQLLSLCLVQIRMLGTEKEIQDFIQAVRKHPTLHSFDCNGCVFQKRDHSNALRDVCEAKRLLHFMFDGEIILEEPEFEDDDDDDDSLTLENTLSMDSWGSALSHQNRYFLCFWI